MLCPTQDQYIRPSEVAEPPDAGIFKEEDITILVNVEERLPIVRLSMKPSLLSWEIG